MTKVGSLLSQPATWSAAAAAFSALAAWLTYTANFRPSDRIALSFSVLSNYFNDKSTMTFSITLLNQGNRGFLVHGVSLMQVYGANIDGQACAAPNLGLYEHENLVMPVLNDQPLRFPDKSLLIFRSPTQDQEAAKLSNAWISAHQATSSNITFITNPSPEPGDTVLFCPVIDFISPDGFPERAVCPGWMIWGIRQTKMTHYAGAGPINLIGYSTLIPSNKWPKSCIVEHQ